MAFRRAQPPHTGSAKQSTSPPTTGRSLRNDGDDDRRRTFLLPREGLQPCVAPYFADLGVGDMRGPPMGAPMMPPRRRWQAVIAPHDTMSHTRDTQHVARNTMVVATACHHLRGGDLGGTPPRPPRMSPRPRVAKYGATHSCHTSGVANYLASRHRASVAAPAPRQTIRHVRRNHPHPHAPRNNRRYSLCDASIAIAATLLTCS